MIEKPARLVGIEVDDGLVAQLIDDTDSGEALPLLAFTLAQLAEGVSRGGRLSSARYDQLGGIQGALTRQADAIAASVRSREQVIAGLLRLVTVDEQGRPTRWRVHRAELPDHGELAGRLGAMVAELRRMDDVAGGGSVLAMAQQEFKWFARLATTSRACAPPTAPTTGHWVRTSSLPWPTRPAGDNPRKP